MKLLDLFAGIGGFSLAAHRMGWETVAAVEWDEYCQKLLKLRFPKTEIYGDIREFDGTEYQGSIDIITGGFPCQPYSVAGERRGRDDNRNVWSEMVRVIKEVRPSWVIAENVTGILSMGFSSFLADLESIGYKPLVFCISSDSVGLQTMERHVWIIATSDQIGFERISKGEIQGFEKMQEQFSGSDPRMRERRDISKTRFCRVGERVSRRLDRSTMQKQRLEALGNSVPPHVVYHLFKAIQACNEELNQSNNQTSPYPTPR